MDSTSVSLLRRLKEPDHDAAWDRFVDLYAPLIFRWGKNKGLSATDSAELVQEVLVVLITKLPEFAYDPSRRFRGWLYTLTVNKARDLYRRNSVRPVTEQGASIHDVAVQSDIDLFAEAEYRSFLVHRALKLMQAEFGEETWQVVWKYVVEGVKPADLAQQMGVSVNWVYLAKSRVIARLREELDGLLD